MEVNMKEKKKKELTQNDIMKLEIAQEIGLMDKVEKLGWGGLTAKETGRIGGIMTAKKKKGKLQDAKKQL
nr:small, acid-soluble spore protein, alpha/beta type [Sedimentibacter sp.]